MKKLMIFLVAFTAICLCGAKYFETRCDLVEELRRQGFPEDQMRDWVCLIESESGRNTNNVSEVDEYGYREYGLYQINDQYWCSKSDTPGKDCNITCSQLLLDDITVASNCAKEIYSRYNFSAWEDWTKSCSGKTLPDICNC